MDATIQRLHVPQLCKCESHISGTFVSELFDFTFHSHQELTSALTRWNQSQVNSQCWVYSLIKIER